MEVKLSNIEEIEDLFNNLSDTKKLVASINKAVLIVEAEAKKKCPVDDGQLRNSIQSKVVDKDSVVDGEIFTNVEYAPYVEYGTGLFAENGDGRKDPWKYKDAKGEWHTTSGNNPQPFLRPALYEKEKEILNIIKEGIIND